MNNSEKGTQVTCKQCGAERIYMLTKNIEKYKDLCYLCESYPKVLKIKDRWMTKCHVCKKDKSFKTRAAAACSQQKKIKCYDCANNLNPNKCSSKINLAKMGYYKNADGLYYINCPQCKTIKIIKSTNKALSFVNNYKNSCEVCIKNQIDEFNDSILPNKKQKEIWKIINERPNYSVSNLGRVKNNKTDKVLKPMINAKTGNALFFLGWVGRKPFPYYGQKLVAQAFLTPPITDTDGLILEHINLLHADNRACNLKWISKKDHANKLASLGKIGHIIKGQI